MNIRANRCPIEEAIKDFFLKLKSLPNYINIAYSGGIDSTVLLHSICNYIDKNYINDIKLTELVKIIPIHIHHGISKYADDWLEHCIKFSNNLGLQLVWHKIDIKDYSKELGVEAAARLLRYNSIAETAKYNPVLLGQHAQDQIETFILQWQRGAGIDGLCSMAYFHNKSSTPYYRPFLKLDKKYIIAYAEKHNLLWIEDDSNTDDKYKRNAVRMQIMPQFNSDEIEPMLRSIKMLQIQKSILDKYLHKTLQDIKYIQELPRIYTSSILLNNYLGIDVVVNNNILNNSNNLHCALNYEKLKSIFNQDYEQGLLILRYWLKLNNLHIPSYKEVHSLIKQLGLTNITAYNLNSNLSNNPKNINNREINKDICIYYDRNYITLYNNLLVIYPDINMLNINNSSINYSILNKVDGSNYFIKPASQSLKVRIEKRPTKSLKHIFQEQKIAPWFRGLPVICDKEGFVIYHPYLNL